MSYNGGLLSVTGGPAGDRGESPRRRPPENQAGTAAELAAPVAIELGTRSADVMHLFMMLQQEHSSARWACAQHDSMKNADDSERALRHS